MPIYEAIADEEAPDPATLPRRSLGPQGLHIVREAGRRAEKLERDRRRATVEAASVRPLPGTSELLARVDGSHGHGRQQVEVYDLVGMMPAKLKGHRGLS